MSTSSTTPPTDPTSQLFARLRRPSAKSHTHRPIDEIVRDLRIGPIERLLLWLSKTDLYVLALSSQHTRLTLASLGMMVLFTSMLAFVSSLYSLLDMLVSPDSAIRWPAAIVLALIYTFGIMIIDREIVGSVSMKSLPVRLFFALGIATAVSFPVKLKFFEGRVGKEIDMMIAEWNPDKLARIESLKRTGEPERQQQREQIQRRIASLDKEIAVLDTQIAREADIVKCDVRCQGFRRQKNELMVSRQTAEKDLQSLSGPAALPLRVQQELAALEADIKTQREICRDFLCKWEALGRIKQDPKIDYEVLSYFVFGFFMLLELVPLALKWSLGKTEYHYYIEARSNLGNQKIIAINNVFMELMQRDPHAVLEFLPLEITDLIAAHMEDESMRSADSPEIDDLLSRLRPAAAAPEAPTPTAAPAQPPGSAVPPSTPPDPNRAPTRDDPRPG